MAIAIPIAVPLGLGIDGHRRGTRVPGAVRGAGAVRVPGAAPGAAPVAVSATVAVTISVPMPVSATVVVAVSVAAAVTLVGVLRRLDGRCGLRSIAAISLVIPVALAVAMLLELAGWPVAVGALTPALSVLLVTVVAAAVSQGHGHDKAGPAEGQQQDHSANQLPQIFSRTGLPEES